MSRTVLICSLALLINACQGDGTNPATDAPNVQSNKKAESTWDWSTATVVATYDLGEEFVFAQATSDGAHFFAMDAQGRSTFYDTLTGTPSLTFDISPYCNDATANKRCPLGSGALRMTADGSEVVGTFETDTVDPTQDNATIKAEQTRIRWDAHTGALLEVLTFLSTDVQPNGLYTALDMSIDGKYLLVYAAGTASIYDLSLATPALVLSRNGGNLIDSYPALTRTGNALFFVNTKTSDVEVVSIPDNVLIAAFQTPPLGGNAVSDGWAPSPDNRTLFAEVDGVESFCDASTGSLITQLPIGLHASASARATTGELLVYHESGVADLYDASHHLATHLARTGVVLGFFTDTHALMTYDRNGHVEVLQATVTP